MNVDLVVSRKGLRVILVTMLILLAATFFGNLTMRTSGLRYVMEDEIIPFDPAFEVDYHRRYGSLSQDFSAAMAEKQMTAGEREKLFERYRPAEDFFDLVDIRLEPLSLIYKGRVEQPDGSLIAQVNWGERTYFVREGESINRWRIDHIDPSALMIQHETGEILTLPYLRVTYRKERNAVIYNFLKHEEVTVKVGSIIEGYTVTDVTETSVTMAGKETFTLTKKTQETAVEGTS